MGLIQDLVGFLSTPLQRDHLHHDERIITDLRFHHYVDIVGPPQITIGLDTPKMINNTFQWKSLHPMVQPWGFPTSFWIALNMGGARISSGPYDAIPGATDGSRNKHRCGSKWFGTFGYHRTEK